MTEEQSAQEHRSISRSFQEPKNLMYDTLALAKSMDIFAPRVLEEAAVQNSLTQFQTTSGEERENVVTEYREGIARQQSKIAREKPAMTTRFLEIPANSDKDLALLTRELGVSPEHFIVFAIDRHVKSEKDVLDNWRNEEEKKDNTINLPAGGVHYKEQRATWSSLPHDHLVIGLSDLEAFDTPEFDEKASKLINVANEALDEMSREHPEVLKFHTSDSLKYIVFRQQQDSATQDAMVVFPIARMHNDVYRDMRKDEVRGAVVSAGFVKITIGENGATRRIYGYSESLKEDKILSVHDSTTYRESQLQPKLVGKGFTFA